MFAGLSLAVLFALLTVTPRVEITFTNAPPSAVIYTSTDLTNWHCSFELRRCDGSTQAWQTIAWTTGATNAQRYWKVVGQP
jgi:hypothetical protein